MLKNNVFSSLSSKSEILESTPIKKSLSDQQPFVQRTDSVKADISECSTNTDDYVTCTDASKRGTIPTNTSLSSTTQAPGLNTKIKNQSNRCCSLYFLHIQSYHMCIMQNSYQLYVEADVFVAFNSCCLLSIIMLMIIPFQ